MTTPAQTKQLLKILIGTAWIDGKIQPEERDYLHRVAKEQGVANDPDIQPLLYEFKPVQSAECYGWVQEYLGEHPSPETCQQLIEAISGLIYSDGEVANEEAKLLTNLQMIEANRGSAQPKDVLKAIRSLYQRWIDKLD